MSTVQGLPQNLEAEEAVLGALLSGPLSRETVGHVLATVEAEDFTHQEHRLIYLALAELHQQGEPVDTITARGALQRRGDLERLTGGHLLLHDLVRACPMPAHALSYAAEVRKAAISHRAIVDLSRAEERIRAGEAPEPVLAEVATRVPVAPVDAWAPVDLAPVLAGQIVERRPSMLLRSDGRGLLYPGKLHAVSGEPEAGKGWLALLACAEQMAMGHPVLYLDFEDTEATAVARLRALGLPDEVILERFHYSRVEGPPPSDITALLPESVSLAILDGVTEAMDLLGLDLISNRDVARFLGLLVRPLAARGPAVLVIDHVARDPQSRGRAGLGAQHKLAGVDVSYMLDIVAPFGRGLSGRSRLKVTKDRPGYIRATSAGRTIAADLHVHSEGDEVALILQPVEFQGDDPLGLTRAERRVLEALPLGPPGVYPREVGDRVVEQGWVAGLARETIQRALGLLRERGLADGAESRWWRCDPAQPGEAL